MPAITPSHLFFVALGSHALLAHGESPATPTQWKSPQPAGKSASALSDSWWQVFDDPQLSQLITEATSTYPGLQAVLARVEQAKAAVISSRASWFPPGRFEWRCLTRQVLRDHCLFPAHQQHLQHGSGT